jgi:hypothetical protein
MPQVLFMTVATGPLHIPQDVQSSAGQKLAENIEDKKAKNR